MYTTTRLTQRLTTATTRLLDSTPPALYRGALALLVALLVGVAIGWSPQSAHEQPASALSRDSTHAGHAARPLDRPAPPVAIHPLATSVPPADVPEPTPEAQEAQIAVMQVVPDAPTAAPAPTLEPTQPITIIYTNPDGSAFARYICQPYGDWRDADPLYAHPECSR